MNGRTAWWRSPEDDDCCDNTGFFSAGLVLFCVSVLFVYESTFPGDPNGYWTKKRNAIDSLVKRHNVHSTK
jgi:hypothetical protein